MSLFETKKTVPTKFVYDECDLSELTPIEDVGGVFVKRDDKFVLGGGNGGKARTCFAMVQEAKALGVPVVTCGARSSMQVKTVALIANHFGVKSYAHCPFGETTPEIKLAEDNGMVVVREKPGYNSVIIKRAKENAEQNGMLYVPFGVACDHAIAYTRNQVKNIPQGIKRIVVPVGGGISLAGILWGLKDLDLKIPVVGVIVGADPEKRLYEFAPQNWRDIVSLVKIKDSYHTKTSVNTFKGIELNGSYEAKCLPFIEDGDLFWIVGK